MIKDIGCRAFPEYADKICADEICAQNVEQDSDMEENQIVVQETRSISENELVGYTEYANGVGVLSVLHTVGKNVTNTQNFGNYTTYTLNAWLQCLGSYDVLLVEGIKLQAAGNYSYLENEGKCSEASTTTFGWVSDSKTTGGNGDLSAYVTYLGGFKVDFNIGMGEYHSVVNASLKVYIGNDMKPAVTGFY